MGQGVLRGLRVPLEPWGIRTAGISCGSPVNPPHTRLVEMAPGLIAPWGPSAHWGSRSSASTTVPSELGAPRPAPGIAVNWGVPDRRWVLRCLSGIPNGHWGSCASGIPEQHRDSQSRPGLAVLCVCRAPRPAPGLAVPLGSQVSTGTSPAFPEQQWDSWLGTGGQPCVGVLAWYRGSGCV